MKEFIPSPDFVEKTMVAIDVLESKKTQLPWYAAVSEFARYAGIIGASLAGILNVIILFARVFRPIICY